MGKIMELGNQLLLQARGTRTRWLDGPMFRVEEVYSREDLELNFIVTVNRFILQQGWCLHP